MSIQLNDILQQVLVLQLLRENVRIGHVSLVEIVLMDAGVIAQSLLVVHDFDQLLEVLVQRRRVPPPGHVVLGIDLIRIDHVQGHIATFRGLSARAEDQTLEFALLQEEVFVVVGEEE